MSSTLKNLGWKFLERGFSQLVQLTVSIILARILAPTDYGAVAMVLIFTTLANVLIEGGFSSALIQKKDADDLDFSTVLYFSIAFAILLYIILFFTAPYIAAFYGNEYEILIPVFRVLGIQLVIFSVNSVQQTYVQKQMMFKNFFWATSVGTAGSAIIGISMAYYGCGIWSLVGQQISSTVINTITLYLVTKKRPIAAFSISRLKSLFDYGIKILGASLLITLYQEIRALIIGKLYSAQDLAFFDRGKQFPNLIVTNINSSIGAVLFPKMALEQNCIEKVKNSTRTSIRFSAYVMSPLMLGLAGISEPFIRVLLTEKWIDSAPLMQLFCIVFLFMPIHTANMQALKAIGKSGTVFKLEIIKKIIELVSLFAVVWISVEAIVINMAVLTTIFTFINAYPNKKLLDYSYREQAKDILPAIMMSVITYIIISLFSHFVMFNDIPLILTNIALGIFVYLGLSKITKNKEFSYLIQTISKRHEK